MIGKISLVIAAIGLASCAHPPPKPDVPIDQKWVQTTGEQHNHEVLQCYEARLKAKHKTEGQLELWIEIAPTGEAVRTMVVKHVDPIFERCVTAKARDWKFAWIKDGAGAVDYKFHVFHGVDKQPMSEFTVQPYPDKFHVQSTINNHRDELKECGAHTKAGGKMLVEWVIGDKGEVTTAKVDESVSQDADTCVLNHIKSWTFPTPPKELIARVRYPFFF